MGSERASQRYKDGGGAMTHEIAGGRVRPRARYALALMSFVTVLGIGFPQPASAEPAGVRAFLDRLVVYETRPEESHDKDLKVFLAPRLAAEVRKDEESTGEDSPLPFMDFEPICQCQDGEGMKLDIRSIR